MENPDKWLYANARHMLSIEEQRQETSKSDLDISKPSYNALVPSRAFAIILLQTGNELGAISGNGIEGLFEYRREYCRRFHFCDENREHLQITDLEIHPRSGDRGRSKAEFSPRVTFITIPSSSLYLFADVMEFVEMGISQAAVSSDPSSQAHLHKHIFTSTSSQAHLHKHIFTSTSSQA
ncbi:uncharacterized protein BO80DRAFT_430437 [Aspergillus ibericus CBS 121593]|uniref:Uncharacterized protein n=1 Tax=Aspergillus ibericus CBS 121593 TaxID=1448316 RepID=A0A395HF20_9EURO|nr:hypothetical protein BO80DRAFT_430437 [Aspergillus ibericus CBS 121593]RAL06053.1 hypothetical protein BO80DRAFT_430437 [Aspergillus ibericus CBS 121593]